MRKKMPDSPLLKGLRAQVLNQYNQRLKAWPLRPLPKQTITEILGVSERDIGVEIKASEGSGTEYRLFFSFQIGDKEAIIDFADLIPLSELGGVKARPLWGHRKEREQVCSELAEAESENQRSHLFFEAVRAGRIRTGDFKVSLILDYEAAAGAGQ